METKEFNVGDKVIYVRNPTPLEWREVGEIKAPGKPGSIFEISSESTPLKGVRLKEVGGYYPFGVFKLVTIETDSPKIEYPKEGNYIVTLEVDGSSFSCGKDNYCFKLSRTDKGLYPCVDINGSTGNGHTAMSWDLKGFLKKWRYATPAEIKIYDILLKPFDVNKDSTSIPRKGSYIVTLELASSYSGYCAKVDYCFKQRTNESYMEPAIALDGSDGKGNNNLSFDLKMYLKAWRFATADEITEYERLKIPYDVNNLRKPRKDDYIVTLDTNGYKTACAKNNYCFKQETNAPYMEPYIDLLDSRSNSNCRLTFDMKYELKSWRFATKLEIKNYDKIGKPYDVTTIDVTSPGSCARNNYCLKVRETYYYLRPAKDLYGSTCNGDSTFLANKTGSLKEWRLATSEEIKKYDATGYPYDITAPDPKKVEFEKDSYIVLLDVNNDYDYKPNYCFKVRETYPYLRPYQDLGGSSTNGFPNVKADLTGGLKKWRKATYEETVLYDNKGPFDVTKATFVTDIKPPTIKKEEVLFKKGDYIVTQEGDFKYAQCGRKNYCFKIREDYCYIKPEMDIVGSTINGTTTMRADLSSGLTEWRYATYEEKKTYDKLGRPFDVTSIKADNYKFKVGDVVKVVHSGSGFGTTGDIVTITELGQYGISGNGYKVHPPLGNTLSRSYNGFNGEVSFELYVPEIQESQGKARAKRSEFPRPEISDFFWDIIREVPSTKSLSDTIVPILINVPKI